MPHTADRTLLEAAANVLRHAYAPYSRYRVGAALRLDTGAMIVGCNVENASLGLTVCAERNAVAAALAQGSRKFSALAIVADGDSLPSPCGACRQVLAEFCPSDFPIHVACAADLTTVRICRLGDLLPLAFAGKDFA